MNPGRRRPGPVRVLRRRRLEQTIPFDEVDLTESECEVAGSSVGPICSRAVVRIGAAREIEELSHRANPPVTARRSVIAVGSDGQQPARPSEGGNTWEPVSPITWIDGPQTGNPLLGVDDFRSMVSDDGRTAWSRTDTSEAMDIAEALATGRVVSLHLPGGRRVHQRIQEVTRWGFSQGAVFVGDHILATVGRERGSILVGRIEG
ncbi:MAG: hypothetical protein GY925_24350 [Actinomycetia bacterium]|nr:hypothetical protein [Actinomycetes bacterium]